MHEAIIRRYTLINADEYKDILKMICVHLRQSADWWLFVVFRDLRGV